MKRVHQSGSAHVVIIICLVVALVGALVWIFWQNFVFTDSKSNNITNYAECAADKGSRIQESYPEVCVTKDGKSFTNPDQKLESEGTVDQNKPEEGYFAIEDWGIQFKQPKDAEMLYYFFTAKGGEIKLGFITKTVRVSKACPLPLTDSNPGLLYVTRSSSDESKGEVGAASYSKKIGNYYYNMYPSTGVCTDEKITDEETEAIYKEVDALFEMSKTVKAL